MDRKDSVVFDGKVSDEKFMKTGGRETETSNTLNIAGLFGAITVEEANLWPFEYHYSIMTVQHFNNNNTFSIGYLSSETKFVQR